MVNHSFPLVTGVHGGHGGDFVLGQKLMPLLDILSTDERITLPKMSSGSIDFVQKAHEYGQTKREMVSSYVDMDNMTAALEKNTLFRSIERRLVPVLSAVNDSALKAGSDAYNSALVVYDALQTAARVKVPGARDMVKDLKSQFRKSNTQAPTTVADAQA